MVKMEAVQKHGGEKPSTAMKKRKREDSREAVKVGEDGSKLSKVVRRAESDISVKAASSVEEGQCTSDPMQASPVIKKEKVPKVEIVKDKLREDADFVQNSPQKEIKKTSKAASSIGEGQLEPSSAQGSMIKKEKISKADLPLERAKEGHEVKQESSKTVEVKISKAASSIEEGQIEEHEKLPSAVTNEVDMEQVEVIQSRTSPEKSIYDDDLLFDQDITISHSSIRPVFLKGCEETPTFSFYTLPPYKSDVCSKFASKLSRVSYDEYQLELPQDICPDTNEARASIASKVFDQLSQMVVNLKRPLSMMSECKIDIVQAAPDENPVITILWPRRRGLPSLTDMLFKFGEFELFCKCKSACLDLRYRVINIELGRDKHMRAFVDAFEEAIRGRATVVDIWGLDEFDSEYIYGRWTGTLRIVVALNMDFEVPQCFRKERVTTYTDKEGIKKTVVLEGNAVDIVCSALPGYVHYGLDVSELQYAGRSPWCTRCKPGVERYHSAINCPIDNYIMYMNSPQY